MKNLASCIPICQQSIESIYARPCSSTTATSRKQVTNCQCFVVFNLILIPQFSSHLNDSCYTSNVSEETELVTVLSPSQTLWWGGPTNAQRIYLYQPVLSSVDDSMICNVPLCALKIEIYCIVFVYFSIPAVWICLNYMDKWSSCTDEYNFRFGCPWTKIFSDFATPVVCTLLLIKVKL